MNEKKKQQVFVIGHKNPDTDSICSALGYAALQNALGNDEYVAKRAGAVNQETQYVLDTFGVQAPDLIEDVHTQVKDVEIKATPGLDEEISLKKAWNTMRDLNEATMPVLKDGKLEGIISIKDIATANMDIYETSILAHSNASYQNILDTIDGTMVVGNPEDRIYEGKILIGAANPDLLEHYIGKGDILILANRYETQLCALEMGAGCLILCMDAPVSHSIQVLAEEKGCAIIRTPYDTYTASRLLNQSAPIRYFMRKENIYTFHDDDLISEIRDAIAKNRHRDFPVIDQEGNYCGMLSRRSLMKMRNKKIVMVDHNEKAQAVNGIEEADILAVIDHHKLGNMETSLPVYFRNQPVGCTATIVYSLYQEKGVAVEPKIAGLLASAILSDTLLFRSPTCTPMDKEAAEALAKIAGIDLQEHAENMFRAGSQLRDKSPEEIFFIDFKKFTGNGVEFGVGQVSSLDQSELDELRPKMEAYMSQEVGKGKPILFFMLTNIINESSDLIFYGENADQIVAEGFDVEVEKGTHWVRLPGVVSRKKQMVPNLLAGLRK